MAKPLCIYCTTPWQQSLSGFLKQMMDQQKLHAGLWLLDGCKYVCIYFCLVLSLNIELMRNVNVCLLLTKGYNRW